MNFDFTTIEAVTFGVGRRNSRGVRFFNVPIARNVREELSDMAMETVAGMQKVSESPGTYEPSQRYGALEHLTLQLDDPLAGLFNNLFQTDSFEAGGASVLREPRGVFCYVCRFVDGDDRKLVGVRRSQSFRGALRKKHLILPLVADELRMVDDHLFRLDSDFDVLIDDQQVCVFRPGGFEAIGSLQAVIKNAAVDNIQALHDGLPFVRITGVTARTITLTMARQLASVIRQSSDGITLDSLRAACDTNSVDYNVVDGKLEFESNSASDLLDILDRRLYVDDLVPGDPRRYRASNRNPRN